MQRPAISICVSPMLGMVTSAQTVTYDFDKAIDFSKIKTYAWEPGINLNFEELTHRRNICHRYELDL
jgi:hypothetical protein